MYTIGRKKHSKFSYLHGDGEKKTSKTGISLENSMTTWHQKELIQSIKSKIDERVSI